MTKSPGKQPKATLHGAAARSAAGEKLGGRPKGVPNKVTTALKEQILGALEAKDGQAWFEARMDDQPAAFMALLGKILPSEMTATLQNPDGGPLSITIQFRKPDA